MIRSRQMSKRVSERKHPCLSPTVVLNHSLVLLFIWTRAREIDKCKLVQPFDMQSAISVSFTETTDGPFQRSRKLPIGSFRNDRPFLNIR